MNQPSFDERKATEAAAYLLRKRPKQRMFLIHLLKLLYIADRRALQRWGRSITWDRYVSMDNGPVLSCTYNLMSGATRGNGTWEAYISDRSRHMISAEKELPPKALSRAELQLLDEVDMEFGEIDRFVLCDLTHEFPEWKDPQGSSIPITIREILRAGNWSEDDIEQAEADIDELAYMDSLLAQGVK